MPRDSRDGEGQRPDPEPEGDRRYRRRVEIVVPTTERWKVGEVVKTDDGKAAGTAPRVIRVRANRRQEANIEPPAPRRRPEEPARRVEPDTAMSPTEGRSGLVVDEALTVLLREHPALGPLRPDTERICTAFGRLSDQDRERWLGMRNGRPRPVRMVGRVDAAALTEALRAVASTAPTPVDRLAVERAMELVDGDIHHLWNLALEAVLPARIEQSGASPAGLALLLPATSPCGIELPPELALTLLPATATWRVERVCGDEAADARLLEQLRRRAQTLLGGEMRQALSELAARVGAPSPAPSDDAAWEEVGLACLRELCESRSAAVATAAQRPAELSAYVGIGRALIEAGRPCMADLAFTAGMSVTGDPAKVVRYQAEARAMLAQRSSVLATVRTDAGYGAVVRPPGATTRWTVRWEAHAQWPDDGALASVGLTDDLVAALAADGIETVGAARAADPMALLAVPGVGRAGLRQLQLALDTPPPR